MNRQRDTKASNRNTNRETTMKTDVLRETQRISQGNKQKKEMDGNIKTKTGRRRETDEDINGKREKSSERCRQRKQDKERKM